jgi:hypothetical protein
MISVIFLGLVSGMAWSSNQINLFMGSEIVLSKEVGDLGNYLSVPFSVPVGVEGFYILPNQSRFILSTDIRFSGDLGEAKMGDASPVFRARSLFQPGDSLWGFGALYREGLLSYLSGDQKKWAKFFSFGLSLSYFLKSSTENVFWGRSWLLDMDINFDAFLASKGLGFYLNIGPELSIENWSFEVVPEFSFISGKNSTNDQFKLIEFGGTLRIKRVLHW